MKQTLLELPKQGVQLQQPGGAQTFPGIHLASVAFWISQSPVQSNPGLRVHKIPIPILVCGFCCLWLTLNIRYGLPGCSVIVTNPI